MPSGCRSCPAAVRWVLNAFGKWQILDDKPSPEGNIRLNVTGKAVVAEVLGKGQAEEARGRGEELYVDHHATCPAAEEWREKNRKQREARRR